MNLEHSLEKKVSNAKLVLYLTDGEKRLADITSVDANIVRCHINSDGHNITQDELYDGNYINRLMTMIAEVIKSYQKQTGAKNTIVMGSDRNAEVALDLLLKENELIDGGILIKPILNIAITDGIRIEDATKVLIITGESESANKRIEEREIADILGVNGYDVTLTELDEDEALTSEDINHSIRWIQENF